MRYNKLKANFLFVSVFCFLILQENTASVTATGKTLIFPKPQQERLTDETFVIDEKMAILVPQNASEKDLFLAHFLVRELSDKYGIAVKIEPQTEIPANHKTIIMGRFDNSLISKCLKDDNLEINAKNPGSDGYILKINSNKIVIAGSDDAGAFYGLQSLRQLLLAGNGKKIQGVSVKDWPNFPFRGIRLYVPGPGSIPFFKRFIKDFMALYKFNKVIIEFNCMRLDKHPEVNAGWIEFAKYLQYTRLNSTKGLHGEEKNSSHYDAGDGYIIEKKDVKAIVDFANENFLEVIPEIPSLTHGYYLLTRHPELAEYPGDRWPDTYCPSNPKSYELMYDVYNEYIDVMHPKMINIGHDEWWGAPLDVCPLCKGQDYSTLFALDVNKIHDFLSEKGIVTAMWGDFLLESIRKKGPQLHTLSTGIKYQTPGGIRPEVVRDSIPKDILIFNWFWEDEEKEKEYQNFGFKQIYGNFSAKINNWNDRIKRIDLQGGAPSSWAATNEFNIGKDLLFDFWGCANLLWSNHTITLGELSSIVPGLIYGVRVDLNGGQIPSEDGDPIEPIDISSAFNFAKNDHTFNIDLGTLKTGEILSREKLFNLPNTAKDSKNCAIAVGSIGQGENPLSSGSKVIPINEDVSSLIFLHACALPSENQKAYFNIPNFFDTADLLGWYEIVYEDGYKSIVPVQYGVNILEWNFGVEDRFDDRAGESVSSKQRLYCYQADPVNCSTYAEKPITFFAFEWVNPRFGKKINEVRLNGTINYQTTQNNYVVPVYKPMKSNAIILTGISKVKKRAI